MGADLGLHHLGNLRASAPSGQLQTTSEHHHPACPCTADPPRRAEAGGQWSQPVLAAGLGKSLSLIYQQQTRLNCKRRVYSAHMKGTARVLSLSDSKKQPELPENQTVWRCDNQGVKEETFIQTGRRGRDGKPGWRGFTAWWCPEVLGRRGGGWRMGQSHICMWIKWEEQLGRKADHTTQVSNEGKIKP